MSKNQDVNSHLYCPHDLTGCGEFRDDLPTLLDNKDELNNLTNSALKKLKLNGPSIDVFHTSSRTEKKTANGSRVKFFSPYARYLAVLPFAEQERLAETARLAEKNRKRKLCPDSVITVSKMNLRENYFFLFRIGINIFFFHSFVQDSKPTISATNNKEDVYRGPMKNFGKSNEQTSPELEPPAKKRRVDDESNDPIEARLNQIRDNMEQGDQSPQVTTTTPSKKNKSKNKAKNKNKKTKTPQKTPVPNKQAEFDYSSVDFKKFAGGSVVEKKNEIKMKFHGKVRYSRYN